MFIYEFSHCENKHCRKHQHDHCQHKRVRRNKDNNSQYARYYDPRDIIDSALYVNRCRKRLEKIVHRKPYQGIADAQQDAYHYRQKILEREILASRIEQDQVCKHAACYSRSQMYLDHLLKSDIKEPGDLFALLEKTECHKTVIAVDIHRLCALERIVGNGNRHKHYKQVGLRKPSEEDSA